MLLQFQLGPENDLPELQSQQTATAQSQERFQSISGIRAGTLGTCSHTPHTLSKGGINYI